jgi:hypothetical protein
MGFRVFTRAMLIGAVTVLMLATTAQSATAQSIELIAEPGNEHCPTVSVEEETVSGGCPIHLITDQPLIFVYYVGGFPTLGDTCDLELTARLDEQGAGYIETADFTPPLGSQCGLDPCPLHHALPWPTAMEEVGPSETRLDFELCIRESITGGVLTCPFLGTIADLGGHSYEITLDPSLCVFIAGGQQFPYPLVLTGGMLINESDPGFEIIHP